MAQERKLPEFTFQKGLELSETEKQRIAKTIRNLQIDLPVEKQKLTQERLRNLEQILENVTLWIKNRLSLDVTDRVPPLHRITIFSKKDWPEVTKKYHLSSDSEGLNSDINEISLVDQENEHKFTAILFHEMVHAFSRRSVHIKKREDGSGRDISIRLFGFRNFKNNRFNWFNEVMTETIAIEIASSLPNSRSQEVIKNLSNYYKNGVILLDMIFKKMSEKTGKSMLDIRNELYTGYFDGDLSKLKIFKEVFGVAALKLLSILKDGDYPTFFLEYIATKYFEIDNEEFIKRTSVLNHGEELTLYNGASIKLDPTSR